MAKTHCSKEHFSGMNRFPGTVLMAAVRDGERLESIKIGEKFE